jgi:hypothetical protein
MFLRNTVAPQDFATQNLGPTGLKATPSLRLR